MSLYDRTLGTTSSPLSLYRAGLVSHRLRAVTPRAARSAPRLHHTREPVTPLTVAATTRLRSESGATAAQTGLPNLEPRGSLQRTGYTNTRAGRPIGHQHRLDLCDVVLNCGVTDRLRHNSDASRAAPTDAELLAPARTDRLGDCAAVLPVY